MDRSAHAHVQKHAIDSLSMLVNLNYVCTQLKIQISFNIELGEVINIVFIGWNQYDPEL